MIIYAIPFSLCCKTLPMKWRQQGLEKWCLCVIAVVFPAHITHVRFCSGNPCCNTIASSYGCIGVHCLRLSLRKGKWVGTAPILQFSLPSDPFLRSVRLKSYGPNSRTQSASPVALGPKVESWKPVGKLWRAIFTCDSDMGENLRFVKCHQPLAHFLD